MRLVERPVARFPWLAALAALLLGVELARPRHRSRGARRSATAPDAAVPARKREARPRPARAASPAAVAGAGLVAWAVLAAGPAAAQTAWARGDAAFRQKRWAAAESLYALRARRGAPGPLRVNLATARALAGRPEEGERDLSRLAADPGPSGQAASYNLGTLLGERGQLEAALGELRRALERDPGDADARWNYEVLRRRLEQEQQKRGGGGPEPQKPQPGQSGQQPQPQPQPGQNPQQPQQPQQPPGGPSGPAPPDPAPRQGAAGQPTEGMTRQQAEQLLGSLGELERLEQARLKRMRVLRDRRTKDW
jgi:tetratricopeptide (TPR) repeat protein